MFNNFIDWLMDFPMPDGSKPRTVVPGLIVLIIVLTLLTTIFVSLVNQVSLVYW